MGTARDYYREYYTERLWDWVPAAIREADETEGGSALRALLRAFASQAAVMKRSQDRLWDDMFVELADDWAVPYIAELVAARLVSALNPRGRRSDVAKTIYYRRRKGTLAVLEQLCDDIAGWDAKLVEEFRRLARSRHGLDGSAATGRVTGTPEGGLADLRSVRGSLLTGDAFDEFHYTPEMRRPRDRLGLRGIPVLGFHLHRLTLVQFSDVTPRLVRNLAGTRDGYAFDPSGRDVPLFGRGRARGDWSQWRSAAEGELPRVIDCRLYNEEIFAVGDPVIAWIRSTGLIANQATRRACAKSLSQIAGQRFATRAALRRVLGGLPQGAVLTSAGVFAEILARTLTEDSGAVVLQDAVALGLKGAAPIPRAAMRAADLGDWNRTAPPGIDLLFDPARGRLLFDPGAALPADLRARYTVGMSAPIGAGAFGRRNAQSAASVHWAQRSTAAGVPANGVLELSDSTTFDNPPNQPAITDLTIRAREQERPYVRLAADWKLGASGNNRTLVIDGLWIGALTGQLQIEGSFAKVTLRYCTLDPGGTDGAGGVIPPCGLVITGSVDELVIENCILPGLTLSGAGASLDRLVVRGSIIDAAKTGATGIIAPRTAATMTNCTVIGSAIDGLALDVEKLDASDTLVAARADVTDLQSGCFRFSARGPGSRVPHPYESHLLDDLQRLFASRRFGNPAYAELSETAPAAIRRGSEDQCEIGAWAGERRPIRLDGLRAKIDEYMPFGRLPALIVEN
ncbi:hypothetical protein NSE01_05720 [Novosphingobium sediminis]|uniref:Uncharacterized protein n=1 Tax=Novosphingobium sediminis TaxID=707214 RepID=A0A512AGB8_9SPHN|nr:hypothetical protein [Novosphingobium sediminis]GEN98739.1 hypothetical protein NSE01_05720 [Novosphingobium sediminis]